MMDDIFSLPQNSFLTSDHYDKLHLTVRDLKFRFLTQVWRGKLNFSNMKT